MVLIKARERAKAKTEPAPARVFTQVSGEVPAAFRSAWSLNRLQAKPMPKQKNIPQPLQAQQVNKPFPQHHHRSAEQDPETGATLYEWRAEEHGYAPRSARWYASLAVGVTAAAGLLVFFGNVLGAIAVAFVGVLIYVLAQRKPDAVTYRLMVDGVAVNNRLYHYQDLDSFNIAYEPGLVKTVMLKSKKVLSPLIQLEIGEANPLEIRDVLLEFLKEDLQLQEPVTDTWARRLGF